jgi:hypothetical protein
MNPAKTIDLDDTETVGTANDGPVMVIAITGNVKGTPSGGPVLTIP